MNKPDDTKQSFPIVCIGASAGGLDALQRFLDGLPREFGFALVFVQHLSSKHKSLLAELLSAKRPSLAIQEISEGLKALPGRLYLCPPGREVRIRGGFFRLTAHPEGLIHLPIDEFLASLAEDVAERAIAVIFSGAGTDGARGSRAIRDAGGTVFVQDPATAEFSSMPLSVIATGQTDAVLSPEDICREILKLQDIGVAAAILDPVIAPEEYDAFFRILLDKTGGRFNHYKKSVVGRRIRRRMYLQGVSSVKEYLDLVSSRDAEAASLASDLMIGVTSFFRDRVAWKAVNLEVVRKLIAEDVASPVRVWTPASATGEEAYTITMMLAHELSLAGKKRELQIFATDVNNAALEKAREGKYPASISADVPPEYIQKYFTSSGDGRTLVVNKEIRESVVFAKQDLLTDPPFSRLDLIICRNFLIYLEPDAQEKSIGLFHYSLKDNGFLFLGNAETVGRRSKLFKTIGHKQCRVYRKIESKTAARLQVSVPYATERTASLSARPVTLAECQPATGLAQEFLLEEYAPAAIAVDQNYDIVYHNGPTNQYLRQPRGVPTQNALDLLPEGLKNRIRGAVYQAGQEGRSVSIRANLAGDDNRKRPVTLRISKIKENLSIIVFQGRGGTAAMAEAAPLDGWRIDEMALDQLESELSTTRQDLKSHIEQLKSVNEELQSSNEELQAANEEMETSREELQSLNEELVTVNSQLQMKIEEQDETNNDLSNFLASTNIPTIFLDQQFRVRRFTPAMSRLLKLIPSDVGRPIIDMSQEGIGPDLIADAQAVLESLVPIRKELVINGTWYIRAALPYRTADNRIEGVIITYSDVTDLKKAEELTRHLASFPQLNPNPIIEVDSSGNVAFSNPATKKTLENLGMDNGNVTVFVPPDLYGMLQDWDGENESTFYREIMIRDRIFGENISLAPQFNVARIYAYDITWRKQAEEALRKSEERFRSLVEGVKDYAIFMLDAQGHVLIWNEGAERIKGYHAEEIIGKHFSCFYLPEDVQAGRPEEELKAAEAEGRAEAEGWRLRKDGSRFWANVVISALRDKQGRLVGFAKITRDMTEHKRAEEALKQSLRRFEILAVTAGELLQSNEPQKVVESVCRKVMDQLDCHTFFNFLVDEQAGKLHLNACTGIPEDEKKRIEWLDFDAAICGRVARDGARIVAEYIPTTPDERTELLKSYGIKAYACHPLLGPGGKVIGTLAFGTKGRETFSEDDLSLMKAVADQVSVAMKRMSDDQALRASEQRLNKSQEIAHLGSWELDLVNNRLTWSDETYRTFGLQPREFGATYEAFLDAVHPDDRAAVNEAYAGSLREGRDTYEIEHRVIRRGTSEVRIVQERCEHVRDETGRVIRSVGMVYDITERKKSEEALKESERRYHSLFENMSEGFAFCKMLFDDHDRPVDFIYLDVNGAFGKITGLKNVVGKKVTEAIPGIKESHPELFDIYGRVALIGQRERFEIEFKPLGMWLLVSVYSMERGYFVAVFDDITERKRSEAEILKLSDDMAARNLELESLNKELEAFNYSISHDLRAPLRSMAGFSKVMMEDYAGKLDDQGKDYLARIRNSSEKMTRLIDDLLRLSKISRQEIDRMDIDLSKLAESVVYNLRESSARKNIEVVIGEGVRASADPNLMRVVMTNLLDNAWKFTGKTENALVEFGSLEKDGKTVYFVKDNGAGFSQQYAYKMFWPFHRLHGDKEFPGTGIGLAIVDRIIRRHGGKVWAEGEVGKGAEVFFTLG